MESDTKRINKIDDKPKEEDPAPHVSSQMITQQQEIPVNIQQGNIQPNIQQGYIQSNQAIISQQPYLANQPITYQPLYNQAVIVNPGQPNLIINQGVPIIYTPVEFKYRPVKMVCPYCSNSIKSKVEQRFNFRTCLILCLCSLLIIIAALNGNCSNCGCSDSREGCCCCCCCCCYKEPKEQVEEEQEEQCCECCNEAIHTCPSCGRVLGTYTLC